MLNRLPDPPITIEVKILKKKLIFKEFLLDKKECRKMMGFIISKIILPTTLNLSKSPIVLYNAKLDYQTSVNMYEGKIRSTIDEKLERCFRATCVEGKKPIYELLPRTQN